MYKVIIIDDESKPRDVLAIKVTEECPMLDIVATASSAQEGYDLCQIHHPDIVFLDVNMPNESGFDFIGKYDTVPFEIIFATAYQEFASQIQTTTRTPIYNHLHVSRCPVLTFYV